MRPVGGKFLSFARKKHRGSSLRILFELEKICGLSNRLSDFDYDESLANMHALLAIEIAWECGDETHLQQNQCLPKLLGIAEIKADRKTRIVSHSSEPVLSDDLSFRANQQI